MQKTWAERLNDQPELESDADEQLLMHIPFVSLAFIASACSMPEQRFLPRLPLRLRITAHTNNKYTHSFTGQVKVHSLLIWTAPTPSAPKSVKLFKNRDDLDFATASDLSPTQTLEIPQPLPGADVFEMPLNRAHWNGTTSVTLFFEDNWSGGDDDVTRVGYVGFKGQFMALNREPINFLYEAAANPGDHTAIPGLSDLGGRVMPGQ